MEGQAKDIERVIREVPCPHHKPIPAAGAQAVTFAELSVGGRCCDAALYYVVRCRRAVRNALRTCAGQLAVEWATTDPTQSYSISLL